VAGNEQPEVEMSFDSKIHFLSLKDSFPMHPDHRAAHMLDKLAKIDAAWRFAKSNWQPRYVMKLDADDLISSKLVGWLNDFGKEAGYLIKHGWRWHCGSRYLIEHTEFFDRTCGSCLIVRSDLADRTGPFLTEAEGVVLDEADSAFATKDHYSLVPGSATTTLLLNDTHQRYAAQFSYLGHKLHTFPFSAVIYRVNTISASRAYSPGTTKFNLRMMLGAIRRKRFITPGLRKEFMLD
jgi:hypothetical protein